MRTQQVTLVKEEVLSLGRKVGSIVFELSRLLSGNREASFDVVEQQEEEINERCMRLEERCLDVLLERQDFTPQEIRALVGSTLIAAKFERLGDHAHRTARLASWMLEDDISIPEELQEMAGVIRCMVEDVLLCFLTDAVDKVAEITQRDRQVDYLHDVLSRRLLKDLGEQAQEHAQVSAQLLFCARYMERMGDLCAGIARRIHFIVTGERVNRS